jgi:NAD(P)-dependent dehydrogenase (short-subunit alcohol dehydrogenase family)
VIEKIQKETNNSKLEFIEIDMLSLDSIKQFIEVFTSKYTQLDILMNNAGLFSFPPETSKDGLDAQFQVNHLALFYLTTQLLPLLKTTKHSRVINVGSMAHAAVFGDLDFEEMNKPENHGQNKYYCSSKAATNLFTFELASRLEKAGEKV